MKQVAIMCFEDHQDQNLTETTDLYGLKAFIRTHLFFNKSSLKFIADF